MSQPPSTYAIDDLVHGRDGALMRTLGLTAIRAALIYPGVYLAGVRGRQTLRVAVYASGTITLGMIALKWIEKQQEPQPVALSAAPASLLPLLVAIPFVPPL